MKRNELKHLIHDDAGQDLAEYGMLSALIAVVVIGAIVILGGSLTSIWNTITNAFSALP
ncbi:MAG TPA: Flp family type IVb pilin [Candidatus Polarisedimenticolia bacterium]|nr:Flp family type IVb pilin [Candidatus Polarisedimenticolia bacterium]